MSDTILRNLLSSRSGLLPTMDETPKADGGDWELVTWLVVLNPHL